MSQQTIKRASASPLSGGGFGSLRQHRAAAILRPLLLLLERLLQIGRGSFCLCAACIDGQCSEFNQARTRDVSAQAKKFGRVYLVVMAKLVGRSQKAIFDCFMQGARFFLEQFSKCSLQQVLSAVLRVSV